MILTASLVKYNNTKILVLSLDLRNLLSFAMTIANGVKVKLRKLLTLYENIDCIARDGEKFTMLSQHDVAGASDNDVTNAKFVFCKCI